MPTREHLASGAPGENAAGMRSDFVSIQYLRGLAALGVLVFHASQRAGGSFGAGAAGVDIFFVISGFIMWVVSARKTPKPGDFLLRRAGRIAPLYWVVTLLVVAIDLARPQVFPNMRLSPAHVIQSLLFLPHADPSGAVAPVIVPGWTLNYEVFFYVVFAAVLMVPGGRRAWVLTAVFALLCFLGLVVPGLRSTPAGATYTDPLVLEFVAGAWLAKTAAAGHLGRTTAALGALGAGLFIFVVVGVLGLDASGWARLVYWGLPAWLIVWGALSLEGGDGVPAMPALKRLGDASYSIYLAHGLALSLAFKLMAGRGLPALAQIVLAVPFAIAAGFGCYHLVEKPLLAMFHRRGKGRARSAAFRWPAWQFLGSKAQP